MTAEDSARRREVKRFLLGKPGSFRWWLVVSALIIVAAVALWAVTGQVIVVFASAFIVFGLLWYRSAYVGDEDEVNAVANRFIVDAVLHPERLREAEVEPNAAEDDVEGDLVPKDFEQPRPQGYEDVPVAPIADEPESETESASGAGSVS